MKTAIEKFIVTSDFREIQEEIGELAQSIASVGLLQPIVVMELSDGSFDVVAGRRRFKALTEFLELKELEEGLHYIVKHGEKLLIQLEENLRRKDFKPIEVARLIKTLHEQKITEFGKADRGALSTGWGLKETANLLKRDKGFVSKMLKIADNEELVRDCTTVADALEVVKRVSTKAVLNKVAEERAKRLEKDLNYKQVKDYMKDFKNIDAMSFLTALPDESVDFIMTDPPYGINLDKHSQQEEYEVYSDDPDEILSLISSCIPEYYRVLKQNKFIVLWTSYSLYHAIVKKMKEAGFYCPTTPLSWVKLNATGLTHNPNQTLGSVCEIAVYAWKGTGAELTKKGANNTFPCPIVRGKRIHVAQKPEALIIQILEVFSTVGDTVLDTFAGSASTLRACYVAKRKFIGCELNPDNYNGSISYTMDWFGKLTDEGENS